MGLHCAAKEGSYMKVEVLAVLILAALFLVVEGWALFKMRSLLKRAETSRETVGDYEEKVRPYLRIIPISSILVAICVIVAWVLR